MKSFFTFFVFGTLLFVSPVILRAQIITTIAGNGTTGYMGDGHPAIDAEFNLPSSIRFDHSGNMYISDWVNNVIRKINTSGIITTVAGNGYGAGMVGVGGYTGDNGPATAAELNGPTDVAFDAAGNMYIADQSNSVIRKVNTSGTITTFAGTVTGGYNGDEIAATTAQLSGPIGLAFDNAGNLYIGDEGNNRVRKINTSGVITTVAGTGTAGYNADGIQATAAQLNAPCYIAISPSGDLYIPELQNHRVRKVDGSGIITTVAGNGMLGVSGDGLPATAANIGGSITVEFDALGNYYISNAAGASCSIRKVNTSGIITTVAGNDTCDYRGDGGAATNAEISRDSHCTAIDAAGNLYISDYNNNRIRRVNFNTTTVNNVTTPQSNISIYPNPARDEVTIKAPPGLPQGEEIERVEILNLIGQEVASPRPSPGEREVLLSVSFLPSGVYFVKVNGVYAGKFIKD